MNAENRCMNIEKQAQAAKEASYTLANSNIDTRNRAISIIADNLEANTEAIINANMLDMENAKNNGLSKPLQDRLMLNEERIKAIAFAARQVIDLPDVLGEIDSMWERPNGLTIGKKRVPLGLIGIIYEARPNVTVDAAVLCLKAGNTVMLRGGSEAFHSNLQLVYVMKDALIKANLPQSAIEIIEDTSRETATAMMKLHKHIDVLIPRGGAGLIKAVVENATIPVIETGTGICHTYIDESADIQMGLDILVNAKCQRPSVCNACETLLVHEKIAPMFLPLAEKEMTKRGVEIRYSDYDVEFLDLILSVKTVKDIDEAIAHINEYGTKHSECIVTKDYAASQKFLKTVDAAAVYVNASTRFTDGFEFGFGAEIGISTQKLHARGPMGIKELTTTKYIIYGGGQIR